MENEGTVVVLNNSDFTASLAFSKLYSKFFNLVIRFGVNGWNLCFLMCRYHLRQHPTFPPNEDTREVRIAISILHNRNHPPRTLILKFLIVLEFRMPRNNIRQEKWMHVCEHSKFQKRMCMIPCGRTSWRIGWKSKNQPGPLIFGGRKW
jgi:hypothetical protein